MRGKNKKQNVFKHALILSYPQAEKGRSRKNKEGPG